jgi:hypothetical protein
MEPRKQTEAFVTALLKHCRAVETQVCRDIDTEAERWSQIRAASSLAAFERLRGWLAAENASKNGQILIRPAAEEDHPWLLLDDVPAEKAMAIANKYAALVVETSKIKGTSEGNCQVRLLADRPLRADERRAIQNDLVARLRLAGSRADTGSVSGVKLGRLPGFRNRKPGKSNWTNLLADTTATAPRYAVVSPPAEQAEETGGRGIPTPAPDVPDRSTCRPADRSSDGEGGYIKDFAHACHLLRAGRPEHEVIATVAERAMRRGKRRTLAQAMQYAQMTVKKALARPH